MLTSYQIYNIIKLLPNEQQNGGDKMRKKPVNLKLKSAIIEAGKTMSEVALAIGTTKQNFSRKLNGFFYFDEYEIEQISEILERPVTDIFFNQKVTKRITNVI